VPDSSLGLQLFLLALKKLLKRPEKVSFINREKNIEAMERHGLTVQALLKRLGALKPENYKSGPHPDDDGSGGSIWVFLLNEDGTRFYIKLKLYTIEGEDYLKILSFHD